MKKKVLITGGSGFVGANLTRRLLKDGHEVHLFVRSSFNDWRIKDIIKHINIHYVDLSQRDSFSKKLVALKPDWIFHLAVYGAYSWQQNSNEIFQTNLISTINLLEEALKVGIESFINTGSSSEYGYKDHAPNEQEWLDPNSNYAVAKASATLYCRYVSQSQKVPITTLRLYSVYGPYEDPQRLIPTLIRCGLKGTWPPLVNPNTARDYIYIDDVCDAYIAVASSSMEQAGLVYNISSDKQTTLGELTHLTKTIFSIPSEPQWGSMPQRDWDTSVWVGNSHCIRESLGWKPHYNLEEGFKKTIEWHRANVIQIN